MTDRSVWIRYRNHLGVVAWRHIVPEAVKFTASLWHEEQWILYARDLDKDAERGFALRDILEWRTAAPEASSGQA